DACGCAETGRSPAGGPAGAWRNASLIASFDAGFSSRATRSMHETFGVGTRIDQPSSLPSIAGSTSLSALAAPVVVMIMLSAAARARRRSSCGRSRTRWSLVYEWIVVIRPLTMPKLSWRTLATGARQFVVHEAL